MDTFRPTLEAICYLFAVLWGFAWAWCLDNTRRGRFLVNRRTWLTVVIGIGVDGLLYLPVLYLMPAGQEPVLIWLRLVAILALSAIGIVKRSVDQEYEQEREVLDGARRPGQ